MRYWFEEKQLINWDEVVIENTKELSEHIIGMLAINWKYKLFLNGTQPFVIYYSQYCLIWPIIAECNQITKATKQTNK